jgi:spore coat polysaccharide biosynthesis protein SpsF
MDIKQFEEKLIIVIQARRGSTRLKDKILLPLRGKELLLRMVERVRATKYNCRIAVATTKNTEDDIIYKLCKKENIDVFRGDENDLLDRHYRAARKYKADYVCKIPSDCPLIDPEIIDKVFQYFFNNIYKFDYVSNLHPASYPDGNDVEIMKMSALDKAWKNASLPYEREHTTPYIWDNPDIFKIGNVRWVTGRDYSMTHRFTIDYAEDYDFINAVYENLYDVSHRFGLGEILTLIKNKPEIYEINNKYAGVNWYGKHIDELKTVTREQTKIL